MNADWIFWLDLDLGFELFGLSAEHSPDFGFRRLSLQQFVIHRKSVCGVLKICQGGVHFVGLAMSIQAKMTQVGNNHDMTFDLDEFDIRHSLED